MLNVVPIFTCANEAFAEFCDHLRVKSLPTVVYLMQRDVINHYRHDTLGYAWLAVLAALTQGYGCIATSWLDYWVGC